jgi:hypothetical protein
MKHLLSLLFIAAPLFGQDYFTERYKPFHLEIPTPKDFLEHEIGSQHTRHDQIVSYLEELAKVSDRAQIMYYEKTHEGRITLSKKEILLIIGINMIYTPLIPQNFYGFLKPLNLFFFI